MCRNTQVQTSTVIWNQNSLACMKQLWMDNVIVTQWAFCWHMTMHSIKLWGVELPVWAKLLQVKPDDTLHTMPVVFGVTHVEILLLPVSHGVWIWPLVYERSLCPCDRTDIEACLYSGLGSNGDMGWLCFPADCIVDVHDDSSGLLQSLKTCPEPACFDSYFSSVSY